MGGGPSEDVRRIARQLRAPAHPDTTSARCDGSVCVETYARMSVTRLPPPRPRKIAATTRYGYDGARPRKRQPRPHIADEIRIAVYGPRLSRSQPYGAASASEPSAESELSVPIAGASSPIST